MSQNERTSLPSFKMCNRTKLHAELNTINQAAETIHTDNITELNALMYAAAYVTTERLGMTRKATKKEKEEPFWKRRI